MALPVSINLSPAGIWEVETRLALEHAFAFHGVAPKLLTVELTEGALIEESKVVRETIDELRRAGVSLAIDDFGTGYSSLAYLRRFPIDQLKIDRSFIHEIGSNDGLALTSAIIGIADALHLRVVAEGVETEDQASALRRLRCRRTQGFLFGKPMPPEELARTLEARVFV
jgi:EAL domain-containing protein (putative c-di-GMP-specific phosphodiesterase class I)